MASRFLGSQTLIQMKPNLAYGHHLAQEVQQNWFQLTATSQSFPRYRCIFNGSHCRMPMTAVQSGPMHLPTDNNEHARSSETSDDNVSSGAAPSMVMVPLKKPKLPFEVNVQRSGGRSSDVIVTERIIMAPRQSRGGNVSQKSTSANSIQATSSVAQERELSRRHEESRRHKNFRKMIESSSKLRGWRLQEGPCEVSRYDPCISCFTAAKVKGDTSDCRFYNRMLRRRDNLKQCRRLMIGDIENIQSSFLMDEENVQQFFDENFATDKQWAKKEAAHIAAYVLQCVHTCYEKVVRREEDAIAGFNEREAFFSHPFSGKQICDVCRFTILNAHFCCIVCGMELCIVCYKQIREKDILRETLRESLNQMERYDIKRGGSLCNGNHGRGSCGKLFQKEKCYCPQYSPPWKFPVETICVIEDQFASDSFARFKAHLTARNPVVVENVHRHPDFRPSLWTQEAFEKIMAWHSLHVLDSRDFSPALVNGKPCTLKMFWSKFASKRETGEIYMKIKDFPESKLFSDIAPEQYANLYEVLPFLDYTHINRKESGHGRLNLLNLFNNKSERPDPGPKTYICFGLYNAPELASTPLHLDVSDAVNFLTLVKAPDNMSRQEIKNAVEMRLDEEGLEGYHKERALREPEKAGALWKIFHPSDNGKIRAAIMDWKKMKGETWEDDVIHNQDVVVTPEMISFFKERGIVCRLFVQNEGDVVFIPAGAAHQVQNINSCIKVAEDIVAAEGIDCTAIVTDELRLLRAKDDLVQIDSLLHLACAAANAVLRSSDPGLVTTRLPQ